ncbi:hypothetical protein QCE73_12645, partial [Caballeronia sp. LZ029]|uniref:hypothetical protein n=1 Tax=Caballeronia sp. LZ029 TaxID=3038564 RepID=UPI00285D4343
HLNFRLASLHQQQRNEIMNNISVRVNKIRSVFSSCQPRSEPSTTHPEHTTDTALHPLPSRSSNREGTEF